MTPTTEREGARRKPWSSAPIVWYRPSIQGVAWRLWGFAALWVSLGSAVLGGLRVARVDFGSGWIAVYALGIGLAAAGPWTLLVGIARAVRVERVLSVHEEGLRWQDGAVVAHFAWSDLDAIDVVDQRIRLRASTTELLLPGEMDGIEPARLAALLMDMRKKALLGLPVRLVLSSDRA